MLRNAEFSRSAQDLRDFLSFELAKRNYATPPTEWYTKPIHKTLPEKPKVTIVEPPKFHDRRADAAPVRREKELGLDQYAAEFFPMTLTAPYRLRSTPMPSVADCPEPEGLPGPVEAWRPGSPSKSSRPATGKSMDEIDRMYAMADVMPVTATSAVALATPYQINLAKLRRERLKIEEDHLLEVKRLEELEKIRGPRPKWYEMKTPDFHYEAHKNNELVKRKGDYQALYDYRMRLVQASRDFELRQAIKS